MRTKKSFITGAKIISIIGFFLFLNPLFGQNELYDGYILISPLHSNDISLVDTNKNVVKTWTSSYSGVNGPYLLEDGTILRGGKNIPSESRWTQSTTGVHGIIEQIDWNGNVVWNFELSNDNMVLHHDIAIKPDGNIFMIAYVHKTDEEAIAEGRDPDLLTEIDGMWTEKIIEVDPTDNSIIWEWNVWDHLVQDYDSNQNNYGIISENPRKININHVRLGGKKVDWLHFNGIDYNADLDQIAISVLATSEIWIIDHSTTTEDAASTSGGTYGKGGDLLYRFGCPGSYGASGDQLFHEQHNVHWIPEGLPGAGNIMVFNNRLEDAYGNGYTRVEEVTFEGIDDGQYVLDESNEFAPFTTVWSYEAANLTDFYSEHMGGAQRMPNGNTFITNAVEYYVIEVANDGTILWQYDEPTGNTIFNAHKYAADYSGLSQLITDVEMINHQDDNALVWYNGGRLFLNESAVQAFTDCDIIDTKGLIIKTIALDGSSSIVLTPLANGVYIAVFRGNNQRKSIQFIHYE